MRISNVISDTQYPRVVPRVLNRLTEFNISLCKFRTNFSQEAVHENVQYIFENFNNENIKDTLNHFVDLLKRSRVENFHNVDVGRLLYCSFYMRFTCLGKLRFDSRRKYRQSLNLFKLSDRVMRHYIDLIIADYYGVILIETEKCLTEVDLSRTSVVECASLFRDLMELGVKPEDVLSMLMEKIESITPENKELTQCSVRVLYELLLDKTWQMESEFATAFVKRLMGIFAARISSKIYSICLRALIDRSKHEQRLEIITIMVDWILRRKILSSIHFFSSILIHAANLYISFSYMQNFGPLIRSIMENMISSSNKTICLTGVRVTQLLFQRQPPNEYLSTPTIFYQFRELNIEKGSYSQSDEEFFINHREIIHSSLMRALGSHLDNFMCLQSIYSLLATICVEIPSGFTAAAVLCLVMNFQELAINDTSMSVVSRCRIHSLVMAVVSLVCWLHKPQMLYSYVNTIVYMRTTAAPDLNPPMKMDYPLAAYSNKYNDPKLFFEDFEVRYRLWKHLETNLDVDEE